MDSTVRTKNSKPGSKSFYLRVLYNNRIIMIDTFLVLFLYCLSLLLIILAFSKLPPLVPLWYSKPWGPDRLTHPLWLFIFPISSIIWYCVDVLLAVFVTREYLIFSQLLFTSSVIVSLVSFFSVIKIIGIML